MTTECLDAIEKYCLKIRKTLADADLSDEVGIANMMRAVRMWLDKIEKCIELTRKGGNDAKRTHAGSEDPAQAMDDMR